MGMYLLAAIVFLLFIVFVSDLLKDAKDNRSPRHFDRNLYTSEFGEDDFFVDDDLDEIETGESRELDYLDKYYQEEFGEDEPFELNNYKNFESQGFSPDVTRTFQQVDVDDEDLDDEV